MIERLQQKIGPLPVWAWGLIGAVGIMFLLRGRSGGTAAPGTSVVSDNVSPSPISDFPITEPHRTITPLPVTTQPIDLPTPPVRRNIGGPYVDAPYIESPPNTSAPTPSPSGSQITHPDNVGDFPDWQNWLSRTVFTDVDYISPVERNRVAGGHRNDESAIADGVRITGPGAAKVASTWHREPDLIGTAQHVESLDR